MAHRRRARRCAFPVYGVLIEHPEGLFLFDTGYRPRSHQQRAALRAAGADARPDDPRAARACGFTPERRRLRSSTPTSTSTTSAATSYLTEHAHRDPREGARAGPRTTSRSSSSATRTSRGTTRAPSSRPSRATSRSPRALSLFETPGHTVGHYSLLVEAGRRAPAHALRGRRRVHVRDASRRASSRRLPPRPGAGVRSIRRRQGARRASTTREIFLSHDMDAWQTYKHAPDFYEHLEGPDQMKLAGPRRHRHRQRPGHRPGHRRQARRGGRQGRRRRHRTARARRRRPRSSPGARRAHRDVSDAGRRSRAGRADRQPLRQARHRSSTTPRSCPFTAWDDIDFEEWRRIMSVNLDGVFLT